MARDVANITSLCMARDVAFVYISSPVWVPCPDSESEYSQFTVISISI